MVPGGVGSYPACISRLWPRKSGTPKCHQLLHRSTRMKSHSRYSLRIECLESRLTPSVTVVNATTAKFTDVDGDLVTIKVSSGTLTAGLFTTVAVTPGHDQLQKVDLSAGGFVGANLTFGVVKVSGGDWLANVGYVNSKRHDLE